jgi:hypothetical protein
LLSQILISSLCCSLALWITNENSCLNLILQLCILGSLLLNSQEFLAVQIDQHIIMMISIAKATPRDLLILLIALIGGSQEGTLTPICAQQFLAKLHLKNRCPRLSFLCSMHNSQTYESRCMCFLLRSPLVFNLSLSKSQKNTLCFI